MTSVVRMPQSMKLEKIQGFIQEIEKIAPDYQMEIFVSEIFLTHVGITTQVKFTAVLHETEIDAH